MAASFETQISADLAEDRETRGAETYGIEALGVLAPRCWDRFGGLDIRVYSKRDGSLATTLIGPHADQSALSGVLLALCDLDLSLLAVSRIGRVGPETRDLEDTHSPSTSLHRR